jgi:hypothetical protein
LQDRYFGGFRIQKVNTTENVLFSPTRRVDRHPCKIAVQDNIAMQVRFKNMVLFNIKIYFATHHLNKTTKTKNSDILLFWYCSRESNGEIEHYFLYPDEGFPDNHLEELDCPFKSTWNGYSDIVGSCDGVFCLVDYGFGYNDMAALWNPSIRKSVSIPRPNVTFTSHGSFVHSLGFGFDSISNDYKLVRVVYLQDCSFDFDEVPPMVEVYTMRRGCWRMITNDLKYVLREQSACAFLNGACHWIGYNSLERDEPRHATVAFNLGDEVFVQMTVPDCLVWDDFIDV